VDLQVQSENINFSSDSVEARLIYFTPVHTLLLVQNKAEYYQERDVFLPLEQAQKMVGSKTAKNQQACSSSAAV